MSAHTPRWAWAAAGTDPSATAGFDPAVAVGIYQQAAGRRVLVTGPRLDRRVLVAGTRLDRRVQAAGTRADRGPAR